MKLMVLIICIKYTAETVTMLKILVSNHVIGLKWSRNLGVDNLFICCLIVPR